MRLALLIRHGAVGGDAERRYVGCSDLPMSEAGEAQIHALAAKLGARVALDAIYCSDLARSRRTAEELAHDRGTPICVRTALREIDMGAWEGWSRRELKRARPEDYERRGRDIVHFRPPGGESFSDLSERVLPCWRAIIASGEEVVAVAGHAGVNRVILCETLGMPLDHLFRLAQRPACLNVIEWRNGVAFVRLLDGGEL